MKAWILVDKYEQILGTSANLVSKDRLTIGGYSPVVDGNYYNEIHVFWQDPNLPPAEYTLGSTGYVNWLKANYEKKLVDMDSQFPFDFETAKFVELKSEDG